jgi:methyl-accepting chemotaxis protein
VLLAGAVGRVDVAAGRMCSEVGAITARGGSGRRNSGFSETISGLADEIAEADVTLSATSGRIAQVVDATERLIGAVNDTGLPTIDSPFIARVRLEATRIGALFEQALRSGAVSELDLFDTTYVPVPGSRPEQVTTRFTAFADRVLPDIQEAVLAMDPAVVFCAAIDRNGYLPTHNLKFSRPQGNDPTWNASNCRNRRIFADRVGLRAAHNQAMFLLQSYRRDMGGTFVPMKDVSSPIVVEGRAWGALRLAYRA